MPTLSTVWHCMRITAHHSTSILTTGGKLSPITGCSNHVADTVQSCQAVRPCGDFAAPNNGCRSPHLAGPVVVHPHPVVRVTVHPLVYTLRVERRGMY